MEAFEGMMTSPEMKEWDKEKNCVDIVYSLEKSISSERGQNNCSTIRHFQRERGAAQAQLKTNRLHIAPQLQPSRF